MSDFNFPGIDLSDPFVPAPASISFFSPFSNPTPKASSKPSHEYGTFAYPSTPAGELPTPIVFPLRIRDFSSNSNTSAHTPPSLSFSRSSSTSSKTSFSSSFSRSHISRNRVSNEVTKCVPLTTFPHFASLPLDIQRNIWKHTLPDPQIIEIHYQPRSSSSRTTSSNPSKEETLSHLRTHNPLPIALQICRISRRLTLFLLHPLSFAHPYYLPSTPYTYINYRHDTIYLSSSSLYPDLSHHILYSRNLYLIRYLALEFRVWCELLGDNHFVNALLEMEGLIEVGIIFERWELSSSSSSSSSFQNASSSFGSERLSLSKTNPNSNQTFEFRSPTQEEERELECIFERESEKKWLWGRVRGWEDVRGKLRFRWKDSTVFHPSTNTNNTTLTRHTKRNTSSGSNFRTSKLGIETETYPRTRPRLRLRTRSQSPPRFQAPEREKDIDTTSERTPETEQIQINYEECTPSNGQRQILGLDRPLEALESVKSLLNSVDDVIMDYGYMDQGRGVWIEREEGEEVEWGGEREGEDAGLGRCMEQDVGVYSESEYSESVCSEKDGDGDGDGDVWADDSDLEGWK